MIIIGSVYYFFLKDEIKYDPNNPLDIAFRNKYYSLIKEKPFDGSDRCLSYYEPEQLWDFDWYIHARSVTCKDSQFEVHPNYWVKQGQTIGTMKFFVNEVTPSYVVITHTANERFIKQFPTGEFELVDAGKITVTTEVEKCVTPNVSFSGATAKYCFSYKPLEKSLVLQVKDL
jgi:hypothetical protein